MCRQVCSNGGKGKYMWSQVPDPVSLKARQCQRRLDSWCAKPQFKHEELHEHNISNKQWRGELKNLDRVLFSGGTWSLEVLRSYHSLLPAARLGLSTMVGGLVTEEQTSPHLGGLSPHRWEGCT